LLVEGYKRAAASFSQMISHPVRINGANIRLTTDIIDFEKSLRSRDHKTIIQTKIIGELSGDSYLMLTAEEIDVICNLSRKAFGGVSVPDELVLSEIDNILSAAVITEISNVLKIRIYGDVPRHLSTNDPNLKLHNIVGNKQDTTFLLVSNANFAFDDHHSICPYFLWLFDSRMNGLFDK